MHISRHTHKTRTKHDTTKHTYTHKRQVRVFFARKKTHTQKTVQVSGFRFTEKNSVQGNNMVIIGTNGRRSQSLNWLTDLLLVVNTHTHTKETQADSRVTDL